MAVPDRTYLFVPGDRPDRFNKALEAGSQAVIIDLEDAVAPRQKPLARTAVADWLATATQRVYVRINPAGTPWQNEDCELLRLESVRGVMLPKAESPQNVSQVGAMLRDGQDVIPLIETVAGWFEASAIARVPQVSRLAFGSFDFMSDSGIQGDGQELDAVRSQLVLLSRHAGLQAPIDGVSLSIDDTQQLEADAKRSRRYGFGGKLCIHPRQVPVVRTAFAPTTAEVDWAQRVIAALRQGAAGAVAVDGKLIDKAIERLAQTVLAEAASMP